MLTAEVDIYFKSNEKVLLKVINIYLNFKFPLPLYIYWNKSQNKAKIPKNSLEFEQYLKDQGTNIVTRLMNIDKNVLHASIVIDNVKGKEQITSVIIEHKISNTCSDCRNLTLEVM